ncbi:MAG: N-acetylmuramoyl-L-alanine amidase [Nitrosomonas sp.]|nr:N-acetylmuramoyl-L-alanine amidase [Nitrosomonas sp.]
MSTAMAETKRKITAILNSAIASHVVADARHMPYWTILLVCLLCILPFHGTAAAASAGTTISAARVGLTEDYTRITLESRRPIQHELSMLNNPGRVVVDLINIPLNDVIKSLPGKISPADPHIERIRYGQFQPHVIRVVLDLKADVVPRTSTIDPKNGHGYQLILDIYRPDKAAIVENNRKHQQKAPPAVRKTAGEADALDHLVAALINHKSSAQPSLPPKPSRQQKQSGQPPQAQQIQQTQQNHQPSQQSQQPSGAEPGSIARNYPESYAAAQLRKPAQSRSQSRTQTPAAQRIITIAIDPGHGGHDPGAIAKNGKGTKEKDITLAISRKLKSIIDKEPNMRAILTRNGDYYLNLNQRQAIARKHKADLFVSIHADGSEKVHPRGSSVYTLSEHGATSTTASWLAKQANQSGNHLIGGVDIASKSGDMREIILDLSMSATINDSVKLAELVLQEIGQINQLHKKTVEQAGFVVLKSPDIPSILVETAFITNPHEEQKLIDKTYQNKMANAIFSGIRNYFATNPALSRTDMAAR